MKNEVIEKHFRANYKSLVNRTTRRVPNQSSALAEEVVQEAYSRALKYFVAFNPNLSTFERWFTTILRNTINDCRTAETGMGFTKEYEDGDEEGATLYHDGGPRIVLHAITEYTGNKERDIEVLRLFFEYGFTSNDVAVYTGMSHTNVRQIIFRFRNKFNEANNGGPPS